MIPPPPAFTLFPYTTLFRSQEGYVVGSNKGRRRLGFQLVKEEDEEEDEPSAPGNTMRFVAAAWPRWWWASRSCCSRSEEHTSELQSQSNLVCRLLLEKKNNS